MPFSYFLKIFLGSFRNQKRKTKQLNFLEFRDEKGTYRAIEKHEIV
jgi:hypothetical protein